MNSQLSQPSPTPPEQVPVFSSWKAWYSLVLSVFAASVLLLWYFSRAFR